ncbi:uncharacterized protein LOC143572304 [Bidens hawaiensis]|uniref:uncharacterized protein LOC143572304 n=1 Tax=Bidens hawaiensis TaxID=980011 RepID=UPI00404926CC
MTKQLEKEAPFVFFEYCMEAFDLLKDKIVSVPIMTATDWSLPLELMCDASDYAVGAVIGHRKEKHFHLIYKQDAKPCLIRWILLLQKFDIEIRDKMGAENVEADHLSHLERAEIGDAGSTSMTIS